MFILALFQLYLNFCRVAIITKLSYHYLVFLPYLIKQKTTNKKEGKKKYANAHTSPIYKPYYDDGTR